MGLPVPRHDEQLATTLDRDPLGEVPAPGMRGLRGRCAATAAVDPPGDKRSRAGSPRAGADDLPPQPFRSRPGAQMRGSRARPERSIEYLPTSTPRRLALPPGKPGVRLTPACPAVGFRGPRLAPFQRLHPAEQGCHVFPGQRRLLPFPTPVALTNAWMCPPRPAAMWVRPQPCSASSRKSGCLRRSDVETGDRKCAGGRPVGITEQR